MKEEELMRALRREGFSKYWHKIKMLARPAITLHPEPTDENSLQIGQSKIGGTPDLPIGANWPRENSKKPLSFIAQINFQEMTHLDKEHILPDRGMVSFFYSMEQASWGYDPTDIDKFRIMYFQGHASNLTRTNFPEDLTEESRYKSCKLSYEETTSVPVFENDNIQEILKGKDHQTAMVRYRNALGYEVKSKMLGHADVIQNEMELECELVTKGLYCGDETGYNDPRAVELEKNKYQWRLLLQICSEEAANMFWGDDGAIYYWIKESDLRKRNFDNCWLILQCG